MPSTSSFALLEVPLRKVTMVKTRNKTVYEIECEFLGELELLQGILVCTYVPEIVLLQTHYSEIQQLHNTKTIIIPQIPQI
jgi:hypothetical protein